MIWSWPTTRNEASVFTMFLYAFLLILAISALSCDELTMTFWNEEPEPSI